MIHPIKAIIYDCDGVMFDSFEANFSFYARVLDHFGKSPLERSDHETMRILHTYSNRDVLTYLFAEDLRKEEAFSYAGTINYADLVPLMIMEEGFLDTIRVLNEVFPLGICTNRSTSMDLVLDSFGLRPYFQTVMTAAKVARPKPSPEPLLQALAELQVSPLETLFIGDSAVDQETALAAGVPFIAYKSDLPALARLDRHSDLLTLLHNFCDDVTLEKLKRTCIS